MFRIVQSLLLIVFMVVLIGCGSDGNPVQPDGNSGGNAMSASVRTQSPSVNNRFLWGIWKIVIPDDTGAVEVIPDRVAALHLNAVRLLEVTPCRECLRVKNLIFLNDNEIQADFELRHPYPGALKYTAFDVRGIFISGADFTFPENNKWVAWEGDTPRMLKSDGYTRLSNPTDFPPTSPPALGYIEGRWSTGGDLSAVLNPYMAYEQTEPRCMYWPGLIRSRTVRIHIPTHPIEFGYAVDACWQLVEEVTDPLNDFPPDANCLEAYRVNVTIGPGLEFSAGGQAEIFVDVYDHQGLETIGAVTVEAPDLFDGVVELAYEQQGADKMWRYSGTIENTKYAIGYNFPVLVRVVDTESDQNLGPIDAWRVVGIDIGVDHGWVRTWGADYFDNTHTIAVDASGNIYVAGLFGRTVDFDPGDGIDNHTADGTGTYLTKYNTRGDYLWTRTWDMGGSFDYPNEVALDGFGNVYMTGHFRYAVDFDPGPGEEWVSSSRQHDAYLIKMDSDGFFTWARVWGGPLNDYAYDMAVDSLGNTVVTGTYQAQVDFDPGPGEKIFTQIERGDVYASSFDPDGNFRWASAWGGHWFDGGLAAAFDSEGSAYIAGRFGYDVDFDPGDGIDRRIAESVDDMFLCKYDTLGNYIWTLTLEGRDFGSDITFDSSDLLHIAGSYGDIVDFDPGPGVEERNSEIDGYQFVACYDTGANFQWVWTWGGTDSWIGYKKLAVDVSGNHFISGTFDMAGDFDPGPGEEIRTPVGEEDCFLCKFDPVGNLLWVATWGGTYYDYALDVGVDGPGNAYTAGGFYYTVDFDPGPEVENHTSLGERDAYLLKILADGTW